MSSAVPAATPTRMSDAERRAVDDAVRRVTTDGPWIGGPEVAGFEQEFGEHLGSPAVVGCANGTDALVLAMTALGIPAGVEVLVPAHDGGYAATAARLAGLVPVTVDVEVATGAPTVATLDAALANVKAGMAKSEMAPINTAIMAFMAGIFIGMGGLLTCVVAGGINTAATGIGPSFARLLGGAVFPVGLMLVVFTGAELFTGNVMFLSVAVLAGKASWKALLRNWVRTRVRSALA